MLSHCMEKCKTTIKYSIDANENYFKSSICAQNNNIKPAMLKVKVILIIIPSMYLLASDLFLSKHFNWVKYVCHAIIYVR